MEKRNIAYLVSLEVRREEPALQQPCAAVSAACLLCTSCGAYKPTITRADLKRGAPTGFRPREQLLQQVISFTKYNILLHVQTYIFLRYVYGPLMETVSPSHGNLVLRMNGPPGKLNKIFFVEQLSSRWT